MSNNLSYLQLEQHFGLAHSPTLESSSVGGEEEQSMQPGESDEEEENGLDAWSFLSQLLPCAPESYFAADPVLTAAASFAFAAARSSGLTGSNLPTRPTNVFPKTAR